MLEIPQAGQAAIKQMTKTENKPVSESTMQLITNDNLVEHVGKWVELYCQVGVVMSVTGVLLNGCGLCRYGIRLSNGQEIGFAFGKFKTMKNGWVSITVS